MPTKFYASRRAPKTNINSEIKIVIAGAGFGGVRCALDLARARLPKNISITLVSRSPHFEFTPSLYRIVAGASPLEVCVPLFDIFEKSRVSVVEDTIAGADIQARTVIGSLGAAYRYDYAVLALGSEINYFGIPGLREFSHPFRSINNAIVLAERLHEIATECITGSADTKVCNGHIVVVGGGPSGVELTAKIALWSRALFKRHRVDSSFFTIDLFEAGPRLVSMLHKEVSRKVQNRLQSMGVNIFLNRRLVKEDIERVYLKDMELRAKTVVWTAGTQMNQAYKNIPGLKFDKKGKVIVGGFLEAKGSDNFFVVGDAASTEHSGTAQTALYDGGFAARVIASRIQNRAAPRYSPRPSIYAVPIGRRWAAVVLWRFRFYGFFAWCLRRLAELHFFLSILPLNKALRAFLPGRAVSVSCPMCNEKSNSIDNRASFKIQLK